MTSQRTRERDERAEKPLHEAAEEERAADQELGRADEPQDLDLVAVEEDREAHDVRDRERGAEREEDREDESRQPRERDGAAQAPDPVDVELDLLGGAVRREVLEERRERLGRDGRGVELQLERGRKRVSPEASAPPARATSTTSRSARAPRPARRGGASRRGESSATRRSRSARSASVAGT